MGRISGIVNHRHTEFHGDRTGFFGFFDSINDSQVASTLVAEAASFVRDRNCASLRGPLSFTLNDECGMLVEGFDHPPAIMTPYNPPYYNDLMQACGFVKVQDTLAYQLSKGEISERVLSIGEKLEKRLRLRVRPLDKKNFWKEVSRIHTVYSQAWEANWGFVPMTDQEIHHLAANLKMIYDPRLVFIAETSDGKPVGFSLALPDINVLLKKINGRLFPTGIFTLLANRRKLNRARVLLMGVVPEYRKRGIDTIFYCRTYKDGLAAGYTWAEFSWILEDNREMNDAARVMGGEVYKRWRFWEKPV